LVMCTEVFV